MALRLTVQVRLVLRAFLRDSGRELYGLELSEETGLQPGTAYPILVRLEHEGWVVSRQEEVDPRVEGRPARRYYRLTPKGAAQASDAVAGAQQGALGAALRGLAGTGETP